MIRWHVDDPDVLREAITFTARHTGFAPNIIEKDYFCSVLLEHVANADPRLTFKGGTCLTKVHRGFYRLSEDLDFSISVASGSTRAQRSALTTDLKTTVASIARDLAGFEIVDQLRGSNASTQYNATVAYQSLLASTTEPIRIELGLREPTLTATVAAAANTVLLHPVARDPLVDPFPIQSLSYQEAMAEKVRAALCRREVAIRDFFDVDYAMQQAGFDPVERDFLDLLRRKLRAPGTGSIDVSPDRFERLRGQVLGQLRPMLRTQEFNAFDLDRAISHVREVAEAVPPTE